MSDERKQMPSASSFERLYNCPGSYRAERTAPVTDQVSQEAEDGTAIHDAIANQSVEDLRDDLRPIAYECIQIRDEIVRDFGGDPQAGQYFVEVEQRIWWRLGMFSGQCDHVVIDGPRALIIDYKTGHAGAPPAERNLQLAGYALLMAYHYGVDEVHVAIVQPRAFPRKSVSVYRWPELQAAEQAITAMLHDAMTEGAPLKAGYWCQYCRAKTTCMEAHGTLQKLESIATTGKLPALTAGELSGLLDRSKAAKAIIKAIEEEAKARMIDGDEVPGYRLKKGSTRKSITDPNAVFGRAMSLYAVDQDEFMKAVNITTSGLKSALKSAGLKGKELENAFEDITLGLTEETTTQPSIERIK